MRFSIQQLRYREVAIDIIDFMQYTVIDVREPDEYQSGHVDGALNIPLSELMNSANKLAALPKDSNIIVYCQSGNRSNEAMNILTLSRIVAGCF
jgi:rhodanese-related sulfurtransferase